MSYCDAKSEDDAGKEDVKWHYPGLPHICDLGRHHDEKHACGCGYSW